MDGRPVFTQCNAFYEVNSSVLINPLYDHLITYIKVLAHFKKVLLIDKVLNVAPVVFDLKFMLLL